ncbi:reverse transcriptase [Senna tora]|uniref:Reverse transcriptase n=1 Tax=Senna tora TaxID=362788 RepID=A0A834SGN8_9FABA|nr:reverse transcriptase [Senna tora]
MDKLKKRELAAIHLGFVCCSRDGFVKAQLKTDSKEVVEITLKADMTTHHYGVLVEDIRNLLSLNAGFFISHFLREVNYCADTLAKRNQELYEDYNLGSPSY